MSREVLIDTEVVFDDIAGFATQVAAHLDGHQPFILWLCGDVGYGKTTFVRAFLQAKGLSAETPVVSPTYTIYHDYVVDGLWYAHLDLYRADEGFVFEELGVIDTREYKGYFVEWPEQPGVIEDLLPTHILTLSYLGEFKRRMILTRA